MLPTVLIKYQNGYLFLYLQIYHRGSMQTVVICSAMLILLVSPTSAMNYLENDVSACSRRNSELSCLLGCFKCAVAFGRKTYNMASCCTECHQSGSMMIDDGPEYCSPRFFTSMGKYTAHDKFISSVRRQRYT